MRKKEKKPGYRVSDKVKIKHQKSKVNVSKITAIICGINTENQCEKLWQSGFFITIQMK